MTLEEAIKIIRRERESMRRLVDDCNLPITGGHEYIEAYDTAIEALQTQQKQTACDFCHKDRDGYIKPIEKNCHAFVSFGINGWGLYLQAKGWHNEVQINYCPMCGRRLSHEDN